MPDAPRGTILSNLFEEIIVRVEEKRKLRNKFIDIEPSTHSPFDILESVAQGKSQLLNRRGARLADVVAADRNGVELGGVFDAEFKRVNDQPHGRLGRVDVFLLRYVLFYYVVLQPPGNTPLIRTPLFRHRQVHGPDDRG